MEAIIYKPSTLFEPEANSLLVFLGQNRAKTEIFFHDSR